MAPLRVLVHDYGGHPFPVQLSRALARRGHTVLHVYSDSIVMPHGALTRRADDAPGFAILPIALDSTIRRVSYFRRYFQELRYGRLLADAIRKFAPDLVISANTPLEAQASALRATRAAGAKFIYWLQDIQSVGFDLILRARLGVAGRIAARRFRALERNLLERSDRVVVISASYRAVLEDWRIDRRKVALIENWASTDELPVRPRDNDWAQAHGLVGKFCYLYAGSLGLTRNPELLVQLAQHHRGDPDVLVVVVSEGEVAEMLVRKKRALGLDSLVLLPYQPYTALPDLMGSADVLVALLDAQAASFSVPSKVLSYLCAARPLLLAIAQDNLAARIVAESGAGHVVHPDDVAGFLAAAAALRDDHGARAGMAENGLRYARKTFDLERIVNEFESLMAAPQGPGDRT